jgi:hypothetical protein
VESILRTVQVLYISLGNNITKVLICESWTALFGKSRCAGLRKHRSDRVHRHVGLGKHCSNRVDMSAVESIVTTEWICQPWKALLGQSGYVSRGKHC